MNLYRRIERIAESILLVSSRRPRVTALLVVSITAGLIPGIFRLDFETGLLDFLPRQGEHTEAFRQVLEKVDGVTNQELVWVELDPEKAERAGVARITDEAAIRAQEELSRFVLDRVDGVELAFGLPDWVKLARFTASGGAPESYCLPESSPEFGLLWGGLWSTQRQLLSSTVSRDQRAALLGFVVPGDPLSLDSRSMGRAIRSALQAYRVDEAREFDLFLEEGLVPIGLGSGMDLLDRRLREDCLRLGPWALLLVFVALGLGFRSAIPVVGTLVILGVGLVWVAGLMGWLGIRLNLVNVALLPLFLGTGINHGIHFFGELGSRLQRGDSTGTALAHAGRGSGFALFLTTAISVGGLLTLGLSGVSGMVELGGLASVGLFLLWLLVLALPGAWLGAGFPLGSFGTHLAPSSGFVWVLSWIGGRGRWVGLLLVAGASLAVFLPGEKIRYQLDVIQGNFGPEEAVSKVLERVRTGVGGAFPEFVIVEGDAEDPAILDHFRELEDRLKNDETGLGADTRLMSPRLVLGSYSILKDGVASAIGRFFKAQGDLAQAAPNDRDAIRAAYDAMFDQRPWAPLVRLCTSRDRTVSVLMVMPESVESSFAASEELWARLSSAVEAADPEGKSPFKTSFLGYRTMTYLFVTTTLAWMKVLFAVSTGIALLLAAVFLRRFFPVLALALVLGVTGWWWIGLLRLFDVWVSVFLLFPLVYLLGIGSDYALHLLWRERDREREEVFGVTGRSVFLSALTDGGVFAIFSGMAVVSAAQVMQATVLATVAIFVVTLLVVPGFLSRRGSRSE